MALCAAPEFLLSGDHVWRALFLAQMNTAGFLGASVAQAVALGTEARIQFFLVRVLCF